MLYHFIEEIALAIAWNDAWFQLTYNIFNILNLLTFMAYLLPMELDKLANWIYWLQIIQFEFLTSLVPLFLNP